MAYTYDPDRMKKCAEEVFKELEVLKSNRRDMDQKVSMLANYWQDDTNRHFSRRYFDEAQTAAGEMEDSMNNLAALLEQSAQRFGSAIDTGNSNLRN